MRSVAALLQKLLEIVTISLLVGLAVVVVSAVVARYLFNASFVWYDEVASVMLAWISFYGATYAALRRRHLGFEGLLLSLPLPLRRLTFVLGEAVICLVFAILAYAGWVIMQVMGSESLISLRWVPLWFTQSVVPIGAALFILAQLLSLPHAYARMVSGRSAEDEEIAEEIDRARRHDDEGHDDETRGTA